MIEDEKESNLVSHARRELELLGEDPDVIKWYLRVIKEYASFGHSGGSAWATTDTLKKLLSFEPLTPITNNPEEWHYHGPDMWPDGTGKGIWQNRREGEAFSSDGGKTYTLLGEGGNKGPVHVSEESNADLPK